MEINKPEEERGELYSVYPYAVRYRYTKEEFEQLDKTSLEKFKLYVVDDQMYVMAVDGLHPVTETSDGLLINENGEIVL